MATPKPPDLAPALRTVHATLVEAVHASRWNLVIDAIAALRIVIDHPDRAHLVTGAHADDLEGP